MISGNGTGILVSTIGAAGDTIQNNFIGTSADGGATFQPPSQSQSIGVDIEANTSGSKLSLLSNLISGNTSYGVKVAQSAANVSLSGNTIGLSATGLQPVGNGVAGVYVDATGATLSGNVISGNGRFGVDIEAANASLTGNTIGLNGPGSAPVSNGTGVYVGATGAKLDHNTISGNALYGVDIEKTGANLSQNRIGTDGTGTGSPGGQGIGVNVAADSASLTSNVVSGNTQYGVDIEAANATLAGNTIGLSADGSLLVPNGGTGVDASNRSDAGVWIEPTATGADLVGNTISGNAKYGVKVSGTSATLAGNTIGLSANGSNALGNGGGAAGAGVYVDGSFNLIGAVFDSNGRLLTSGNFIAGNFGPRRRSGGRERQRRLVQLHRDQRGPGRHPRESRQRHPRQ